MHRRVRRHGVEDPAGARTGRSKEEQELSASKCIKPEKALRGYKHINNARPGNTNESDKRRLQASTFKGMEEEDAIIDASGCRLFRKELRTMGDADGAVKGRRSSAIQALATG